MLQRISYHTARGSDEESDSEESGKNLSSLPLSTTTTTTTPPSLTPHSTAGLPVQPGTGVASTALSTADQPASQPANGVSRKMTHVGRARAEKLIQMHKGKCLGEGTCTYCVFFVYIM